MSSLKISSSLAIVGALVSELISANKGIGYLIIYGTQVFNLSLVMAGILILVIISYILYKIITFIENKLIKKF